MSFMQPEVWQTSYYVIETSEGTEYVEAHFSSTVADLRDYLAGRVDVDDDDYYRDRTEADLAENPDAPERVPIELTPISGWMARMSAPGYMDATDVCGYETEKEALQSLLDHYGDQSGEPEEWEEEIEERIAELS